jgi:hypothetical protein
MKSNTKRPSQKQSVPDLPLFDRRIVVVRPSPSTIGGRFIARRYRVDPAVADLIAALAGLGSEVRS